MGQLISLQRPTKDLVAEAVSAGLVVHDVTRRPSSP